MYFHEVPQTVSTGPSCKVMVKLGVLLRKNATVERSLAFGPSVLFGENFLVKKFQSGWERSIF